MAATYCTEAQVVSQLGLVDVEDPTTRPTFSASTLPTLQEFTDLIEDAEAFIDNYCNTSWKTITVTDELHSFPMGTYYLRGIWRRNGYLIQLGNRNLLSLTKLEVWEGDSWTDVVASGTAGEGQLDDDYWLNEDTGILWLNNNLPVFGENTIKVTYTYGQTSAVPKTIRRACVLLAAAYFIESGLDWVHQTIADDNSLNNQQKAEAWEKRAMVLLDSEFVYAPIYQR